MANPDDVGIVGGVHVGLPILMTMGAFLTVALYNVVELNFLAFTIFQQRKGLYFWSFLIATWGIAIHAIGYIFKFFQITTLDVLSSAVVGVGWVGMVTGQSFVLYSRLHLVVWDRRRIRWVLRMIILNAIVIHCPMIAIALCTQATQSARIIRVFLVYDNIQIVAFFIQEAIISVLYIYETARLLGQGNERTSKPLRKLLAHLIIVNVVVLILDASILAIQFCGLYEIQTTCKSAVYSIKLKVEFSILNRLVGIVKNEDILGNRRCRRSISLSLGMWTASKKTQSGAERGHDSPFVRLDDTNPGRGNDKQSIQEVCIEDSSVALKLEPLDSESSVEQSWAPDLGRVRVWPGAGHIGQTGSGTERIGPTG